MEHAPQGSMRDGASALSETHITVMAVVETVTPSALQAVFFEVIERGPETLVEPIEAEFRRRGLDPYGEYPVSVTGL